MEAFKISVEVSVNLSENTQNFIKSLFGNAVAAVASAPAAKPVIPTSAAPAVKLEAPAVKPVTPAPAAPVSTPSAAAPVASAPAAPAVSSATKSIEDVRKVLAEKVNANREAIKQKLNELGAPSVTKLDPSKYDEMYNFLAAL